jgi:hypothetical protein
LEEVITSYNTSSTTTINKSHKTFQLCKYLSHGGPGLNFVSFWADPQQLGFHRTSTFLLEAQGLRKMGKAEHLLWGK